MLIILKKLNRCTAIFIFSFILTSFQGYAQIDSDSLKVVILNTSQDSIKVSALETLVVSFLPKELDSAQYYLHQLEQFSLDSFNTKGQVISYSLAARIHYLKKEYSKALEVLDTALKLARTVGDKKLTAPIIRKTVMNYVKLKEYEKAISFGQPYLDKTGTANIPLQVLNRIYLWLGQAYLELGQKEKTITFYDSIFETTPKTFKSIGLLVNMTIIVSNKGDIMNGLKYLMPALEIVESRPLETYRDYTEANDVGRFYRILGGIYVKQKEYDKALTAYDKAIIVSKQAASHFNTVNSLYSKAVIHQNLDEREESRKALLEGYTIAKEQKIISRLYHFSIKLGYANLKLKNYDQALEYLHKAVDYANDNNQNLWLANAYASLGEAYLETKQYQKAQDFLIESKKTFDNQKNYTMDYGDALLFYKSLYVVDSSLQDYKSSLKNYEQYIIVRDSVNDVKRQDQIAELQTKYETDKKEKAIALLTSENELQKLTAVRNRNEKILFVSCLVLLLSFLIIGYFLYRNKAKTLEIITSKNIAIAQKNEENKMLVQEIHHRVKNNLQIVLSLLRVSSEKKLTPSNVTDILTESQNKIKSIALIHQNLYKTDNYVYTNSIAYFEELIQNITYSYLTEEPESVRIIKDIKDIQLPMSIAVSVGLIVNELLTNTFKHAFSKKGDGNQITISFQHNATTNTYELKFADNGHIAADFEKDLDSKKSFGMEMIKGLVNQLSGTIEMTNDNGLRYHITLQDIK